MPLLLCRVRLCQCHEIENIARGIPSSHEIGETATDIR